MTSDGASDWSDGIAGSVVCLAARHTPGAVSERLREEWLSDLIEQRRPMARARFAVGCCWAAMVIAHESGAVASVPIASAASAPGSSVRPRPDDPSPFTGGATFLLIALLQAGLIVGVAMGYGR